jgi:hypothetical protein
MIFLQKAMKTGETIQTNGCITVDTVAIHKQINLDIIGIALFLMQYSDCLAKYLQNVIQYFRQMLIMDIMN